jgi:hypothetical protein
MADPNTNVNAAPPLPPPPPPPPPPEKAVEHIESKLQDGLFDGVSQDEVKDVAETLVQLPKEQTSEVINRLADSGALDKFAEEAVGTSWGVFDDGLSADERGEFFANMARNADGEALARLTQSFGRVDSSLAMEASDAVAAHASPEAKVAYIQAMAPKTTDNPTTFDNNFGSNTTTMGDTDARAVANVLSSMRGTNAQDGFAQLNSEQLKAVWQAAAGISDTHIYDMSGYSGGTILSDVNPQQFRNLMTAANSMPEGAARDNVINTGSSVLADGMQGRELPKEKVAEIGSSILGAAKADGLARMSPDQVHALSQQLSQNPAALPAVQQSLATMPASQQRDALIRELFLNTPGDAFANDPALVNATSDALASAMAPGDPNASANLKAMLSTEDGRELLTEKSVDGSARLWAARQAITDPAGLNTALRAGDEEQQDTHPWERSAIVERFAQSHVDKYAQGNVREPMLLSGNAIPNTIGAAMGMPVSSSLNINAGNAADIQAKIARGEVNAYGDGDKNNNPVIAVTDGIAAAREDMGLVADSPIRLGMIPVQFSSKETGPVSLTLYEVQSADGKQSRFVDNQGRVYDNFDEWTRENELPPGKMTYPEGGKVGNTAADTKLVTQNTPKTVDTTGERIWNVVDKAALIGGVVAGVVIGAVLIGASFGTATPLVLGVAGTVSVSAGLWQAGNGIATLNDRAQHGQSIALSDPAARAAWIDVVAGSLPAVSATAGRVASSTTRALSSVDEATTLASSVGYGSRTTQIAGRIATVTNTAGVYADLAAVGNQGVELALNWNNLTPEQRVQGVLTTTFWAGVGVHGARTHMQNGGRLSELGDVQTSLLRANVHYGGAVAPKPTLEGNQVRVIYEYKNPARPVDSEIKGVRIEYGPQATVADIRLHQDTAQLMIGNRATQRLASEMGASGQIKPGTYGSDMLNETKKLGSTVDALQAQLGNPNLSPSVRADLSAKLVDAQAKHAYYDTVLRGLNADPALANLPGRGYVEAPSLGSTAAQAKGWPDKPPPNHHFWMRPDGEVVARANNGHGNGNTQTWDGSNWVPTSDKPIVPARYVANSDSSVPLNNNLPPESRLLLLEAQAVVREREVYRATVARLQPEQEALRAQGRELSPDKAAELKAAYAGVTQSSERVGDLGAAISVKQTYPDAVAVFPTEAQLLNPSGPMGSGKFDQIWRVPGGGKDGKDLYIVVEAKGGQAQLGTRQVGGIPYQQGTREYYEELQSLTMRSDRALGSELQRAYNRGDMVYLKAQTPIDPSKPNPLDVVKLREFDLTPR